jgi:drug/metabolite transporter (DMT)-like permease
MKTWIMFIVLGIIWGSSFLLIKVGVAPEGTDPTTVGRFDPVWLAAIRLTIASVCFLTMIAVTKRKLPTDLPTWIRLLVMGILNSALPFTLFAWAERYIDSGLASVWNATVPLFSLVMAHYLLHDDKMTVGKVFGIIGGFVGAVILATRGIDPTRANPLEAQLVAVLASISYAAAAIFSRRELRKLDPMMTATGTLTMGALSLLVFIIVTRQPLPNFATIQPDALRSVLVLGFFNTFVAYLLFFSILPLWGAARTSMVTYIMPPIGIVLGVLFENERLDIQLVIGAILILGGVILANLWKAPLQLGRKSGVVITQ